MRKLIRGLLVFLITLTVSAPVAFVLFALGLVVAAVVIFPTAILATSVFAALTAAWTATPLVGDHQRTDIAAVAWRNLAWALIPAAPSPLLVTYLGPLFVPMVLIVVYTSLIATILSFRHRSVRGSVGRSLGVTAAWLAGDAAGVVLIIYIASLFGLTGA